MPWLLALAVLIPAALAARETAPPGRKKQPAFLRKLRSSSWGIPLFVVGLILAPGVIAVGVRSVYRRMARPPLLPADVTQGDLGGAQAPQGRLPFGLDGALGEQAIARMARLCPRLSAIEQPGAAQPSELAGDMVSVECMGVLCEHPETAEAVDPSLSPRIKLMCDVLSTGWKDRMKEVANAYRLACPEAAVHWAERPWSPSTELGLYRELRPCLERICEKMVLVEGIPPKYCTLAADMAEGFGDTQAASRLRRRAEALQALSEALWQELTPQQREQAETAQDMKILAIRWGEACHQGMQRYCDALAKYCHRQGAPAEACSNLEDASPVQDAGPR
jgi:hypothetical protein